MAKSLALAACLVATAVTLQGCGGGGASSTTAPTSTAAPTSSTASTTSSTSSTEPGTTTTTTTSFVIKNNTFCTNEHAALQQIPAPGQPIGWNPTGAIVGKGKWCAVGVPPGNWKLTDYCGGGWAEPVVAKEPFEVARFLASPQEGGEVSAAAAPRVKVLTYNLYWWNLFRQRQGADGMAGKNIAAYADTETFDLMGFQECEDVAWPLRDAKAAGMKGNFNTVTAEHAIALAYNTDTFSELERGKAEVAEDGAQQDFGRRSVVWVRLRHSATGKTVFFINHHGPTPVNSGGVCGGEGTAYNILRVIAQNAKVGDRIILVGDFNAWSNGPDGSWLQEIGKIDCHLPHAFSNPVMDDVWGIDNFFGACVKTVETQVMPKGGSDHNALYVVFEI